MTEDDFEPRENDHLVEPMFAGLGVGEEREPAGSALEAPEEAPDKREPARGFLAAVLRWLRRGGS